MGNKIVYIMSIFMFVGVLASCYNAPTQDKDRYSEEAADSFAPDEGIDLNNLSTDIAIPTSKNSIKLSRGAYVYTYEKKTMLRNEKYTVFLTNMLSYNSEHKPSPDDAYSRTLEIVSAKDQSAIRAIKSLNVGGGRIEVKGDKSAARQIIADVKHLNSAKFPIGILPARNTIKEISKQIKEGDTIIVSGVRFKLEGITHNGKKQPIAHCVSMDAFYLQGLKIDK